MKYAKSTVSTCLKSLERSYLISKVREKRKYKYKANLNFLEIFFEMQRNLLYREIEPLCNKIKQHIETANDAKYKENLKNILDKLMKFRNYLKSLIEMRTYL